MAVFHSSKPLSFERRMAKGAPWLLILAAVLVLVVLWGIIVCITGYRTIEIYRKNEVQNTLDSFAGSLTDWVQPALINRLSPDAVLRDVVYSYRITDKNGTPIMPDYSYSPVPVPPSKYLAFVQQRVQDTDLASIPAAAFTNNILALILKDRALAEQLKNDTAVHIELGWRLASAALQAHNTNSARAIYSLLYKSYSDYLDHYGFPVQYTARLESDLLTADPEERRILLELWCINVMQKMNPSALTNAESVISVLLHRAGTGLVSFSPVSLTNWFFPSHMPSCSYSYHGTNYTAWLNPGKTVDWLRKDWLPANQSEASNAFIYLRLHSPAAAPPVGEFLSTNIWGIAMSVVPFDAVVWESRRKDKTTLQILLLSVVLLFLCLLAWRSMVVIRAERQLKKRQLDFVAAVSHELRTPVASVKTLAETMKRGLVTDPKEQKEYSEMIIAESDRLTRLVDNILDVANNSRLKDALRLKELHVKELFDAATISFARKVPAVSFAVHCEPSLVIQADREAMERVLYNLVDNAIKYTNPRQDPAIELTAVRKSSRVIILVKDNGIGIPKKEQERIFERFYRTGDELVRENPGTGLGLAIVKELVEAHNGTIEVESVVGQGSVFKVKL
jgi:signal transduction histidine kinase